MLCSRPNIAATYRWFGIAARFKPGTKPCEPTRETVGKNRLFLSGRHASSQRLRKRVLIVNCYFDDDSRQPRARTHKLPKPMGAAYLAGAFSPDCCDVRLYCEMYSGPLDDPRLLAWPDMLVMTGITTAFDRMLHLAAYARTFNDKVIV